MKIKIFISTALMATLLMIAFVACEDKIDPLIDEVDLDRTLTPAELVARIRNLTTIELEWNTREGVDHYVVEFSEDSLEFNTIIRTATVSASEIPFQSTFEGETLYSARVKAVAEEGSGLGDSKWTAITIRTAQENILSAVDAEDITATEVTLRWPAASEVTRIVLNPGNIQHTITTDEKAAGVATVEGLTGSTLYTANLINGSKTRGTQTFTTLIDLGGAIAINPGDDMKAILDAAEEGAVFVVFPGTYSLGSYVITKSFTLSGYLPNDKPIIYGQFTCGATVASIEFKNLIVRGNEVLPALGQFFNLGSGANIGTLSITDSEISHFLNNLIYNNSAGVMGSITITGSYIHDIEGGGGDGIDFRGGSLGSFTAENTTFANGFRTFYRMQVSTATLFKNCTFYRISFIDNSNNAGLFRSSGGGTFEVRNSLFVATGKEAPTSTSVGNFCRQASNMTATPTYANNNISACLNLLVGLYTSAAQISATELDPGFVDAANGNFTVTNQTLIDNVIGDPRWLQ